MLPRINVAASSLLRRSAPEREEKDVRREERRSAQPLVWTHSPTGCTDGARETEEETGTRCCWQPSQSERTGGGVGVAGGRVWAWPGERPCPRLHGGSVAVMLLARANISVSKLFLDWVVSGRTRFCLSPMAAHVSEPTGNDNRS